MNWPIMHNGSNRTHTQNITNAISCVCTTHQRCYDALLKVKRHAPSITVGKTITMGQTFNPLPPTNLLSCKLNMSLTHFQICPSWSSPTESTHTIGRQWVPVDITSCIKDGSHLLLSLYTTHTQMLTKCMFIYQYLQL